MAARKSSLAARAAASGQLNEIEAFMLDSGSELSSLSEDSSSDESFDCPDDIISSETEEEIILEEDEYDNQNIVDMNVDSASQTHNNDSVNNNSSSSSTIVTPATRKRGTKRKKVIDKYSSTKWVEEPPVGNMTRRQFIGVPGLGHEVKNKEPIELFELMITDELVEYITEQTNLYFKQNLVGKTFTKHSRIQKHLSKNNNDELLLCNSADIRCYIATALYRGVLQKPTVYMYYTQDKLFETPGFKKILTQNKLVLIEKYIHFVDISQLDSQYNRTAKIEPIHTYLVERWQSLLTLGRDISVDEALLLWKGRLSWKQFIRTKRARFGIKSFVLADASTGYVWNSILYSGDDTNVDPNSEYQYQATNIVMTLTEKLLDEGRCLYIDNWYSSMELLDELGKRGTDVVGTVRKDRKGLSKEVMNAKLKEGEKLVGYCPKYSGMCIKWKDKREVHMLTSCIPDDDVIVRR